MSFLTRLREMSTGVLGESLALIFGIIFMLTIVYALALTRSATVMESLYVDDPLFHIDTVQLDSASTVAFVDDKRPGRTTIAPSIANNIGFERLTHQLSKLRMRAYHHQNYYLLFFRLRYGMSICQAITSLFALVLGLLITRQGWSTSNSKLLVSFFVFSGFTAMLQLMPESLQLDENITSNTAQYEIYENLEAEMLTYMSTGLGSDAQPMPVDDYIVYVDHKMRRALTISVNLSDFPTEAIESKLTEISDKLGSDEAAKE